MNSTVNEITKSIIGKFSLYESDTEELRQLTSQYPFFGPAQFLLAKRLKQDNSPLLSQHIQKASLYFQNPVWFDHLLNDNGTGTGKNQNTGKKENAFFMPLVQMEIPATYEVVLDQTKTEHITDSIPGEQHGQNNPELFIKFPKFKFETIDASIAEIPATDEVYPDQTKNEQADDVIPGRQAEHIQTELLKEHSNLIFAPVDPSTVEIPATVEEYPDQTKNEQADDTITGEQIQPADSLAGLHEPKFEPIDTSKVEIPVTNEEVVDQSKTELAAGDMIAEEQAEQNQPALVIEFPKFKFEPVDPSKTELIFEPYHTIDYFASQGIRNKEEEKPKDQFSRQLKSFTEWLKIMKRLPVSEIAATVSATDEKKVENLAEISLTTRDVVTEAMAEVWEKQGNTAKAIEVYQKLSLLNPGKSSYFAAKIELLKNL